MSGQALPADELSSQILRLLRGPTEDLECGLLDLMGFDSIEFISLLVSNRTLIVERCRHTGPRDSHSRRTDTPPINVMPAAQVPGQNVALMTESAREQLRQIEKLRAKGVIIPDDVTNDLRQESPVDLTNELRSALGSLRIASLPHVYARPAPPIAGFQGKFALPTGTDHFDDAIHEEFIIPYASDASIADCIEPIVIADLDESLRRAFPDYKALNRMQSAVHPVAYNTNENMLICAPTGAGKTDVAMLTILRCLRDHGTVQEGDSKLMIKKDEFKIVYVAPMKALAAEITEKFSKRLRPFSIRVREYTGDMQLTRKEVQETQVIVTTPEKWDVITRKGVGDVDLVAKVRLLIIDEVHLLQEDRGPVIETLVARTLREVEISQRMIRIVGLSATLPNFVDVAMFLRVDLSIGLFVFGDAFRPVPLTQHFIGIKGRTHGTFTENLNRVCFDKCRSFLVDGHQVMIFVHARMETVKTAKLLLRMAQESADSGLFLSTDVRSSSYEQAKRQMEKSRNRELKELFKAGLAFHHAGMIRSDRSLVESLFAAGHVRVLCCTSTLAWGVNLPAHAVIIKGTQIYDQNKGDFVPLGVLDVLQIFGRAGRPQFETHGEGIILTPHADMAKYINSVLSQLPIESQFLAHLADNLNAEIALGTVTSLDEAVAWLKYSYLYVRMRRNPTVYGITPYELRKDPDLGERLHKICRATAIRLRDCGMISFDEASGILRVRDVGRIASSFYLNIDTIEAFGQTLRPNMSEEDILAAACSAAEFKNLRVRDEELPELEILQQGAPLRVRHDLTTFAGKASLLTLAYISHYELDTFSLISDSNYVAQNAGRVFRALFEILRSQGWLAATLRSLSLCKIFERRVWPLQHPLAQYGRLSVEILRKLERAGEGRKAIPLPIETLAVMGKSEIASLIDNRKAADLVKSLVSHFPTVHLVGRAHPITNKILRIDLTIKPTYVFDENLIGATNDLWWIFVENPLAPNMIHCEEFSVNRATTHAERTIAIHILIPEPLPGQLYVRVISDRWLHAEVTLPLTLSDLVLPRNTMNFTNLLSLRPLPISALQDSRLERLYGARFLFFNAVQTQVFHALYHGKENVLVGAPTGSGKTLLAELAIWNALRSHPAQPSTKIVYVAPLKALLKEKLAEWKGKMELTLGIPVVELSGDTSPDQRSLRRSRIILTTPEKWDSFTRAQKSINTCLLIMDEVHLLGAERGQVLEMIIARARREPGTRLLGLSTALSNAADLATWMGPKNTMQFNFRPSVRPVPLEVRIEGFPGRHYCPRMATMNKPIYSAISSHSSDRPVLIFVSSRRQTRLTANALISFCVHDGDAHRFVRDPTYLEEYGGLEHLVQDGPLRHALSFGIALHHAGLVEGDRRLAETLFSAGRLQVMIATSTLAWGVNFPAHLVIVKGTEYFDAPSKTYVDYPLTDVMQMIGRAGRPQFDTTAKAVLLVQAAKKEFYKRFLYESFPLESSLHLKEYWADHLNAEVANGRIVDGAAALQLLQETFLAIRINHNPNYYGIADGTQSARDEFLARQVSTALDRLEGSGCIQRDKSGHLESTDLGRITSHFYISHQTARLFIELMSERDTPGQLLRTLSLASEFDESPIRHNEDSEMEGLAGGNNLRAIIIDLVGPLFFSSATTWEDPHTKVFVLLVAHLTACPLPIMDLVTDTRSILEQAGRIVQAMIEMARTRFHLETFRSACKLAASLSQGVLPAKNGSRSDSCFIPTLRRSLPISLDELRRRDIPMHLHLSKEERSSVAAYLEKLPLLRVKVQVSNSSTDEHVCRISLWREDRPSASGSDSSLYSSSQWHLLIGDQETNTILAYTRATVWPNKNAPTTLELKFPVPPGSPQVVLYVLNDTFPGVDHEIILTIE